MNKIIRRMTLTFLVCWLCGCTTIKVVEPSVEIPPLRSCEEYSLLGGKSFADALNTIALNKKIYEDCKNIVDFQNNFIKALAK